MSNTSRIKRLRQITGDESLEDVKELTKDSITLISAGLGIVALLVVLAFVVPVVFFKAIFTLGGLGSILFCYSVVKDMRKIIDRNH